MLEIQSIFIRETHAILDEKCVVVVFHHGIQALRLVFVVVSIFEIVDGIF